MNTWLSNCDQRTKDTFSYTLNRASKQVHVCIIYTCITQNTLPHIHNTLLMIKFCLLRLTALAVAVHMLMSSAALPGWKLSASHPLQWQKAVVSSTIGEQSVQSQEKQVERPLQQTLCVIHVCGYEHVACEDGTHETSHEWYSQRKPTEEEKREQVIPSGHQCHHPSGQSVKSYSLISLSLVLSHLIRRRISCKRL